MRYLGSVQYRYRIANQAIDIAGVAIKVNEVLFTINAAANRDPARFQQPERIDLQRARPRDHIAFNTGPRMCVGAGLARAEIRIALDMLFQQLPHLRLDSSQPAASFTGFFTRSYRPLHVIWG